MTGVGQRGPISHMIDFIEKFSPFFLFCSFPALVECLGVIQVKFEHYNSFI